MGAVFEISGQGILQKQNIPIHGSERKAADFDTFLLDRGRETIYF